MTLLRLLATALGSMIGILLGVLFYGQSLEKGWHVSEEMMIMAPITTVHSLVNSPKTWLHWGRHNMEESLDYETWGTELGVGSGFRWYGKDRTGSLEITRSDPKSGISYRITGWGDGPAEGQISYKENENYTLISWEDNGDLGLLGGYVSSHYKYQKQSYIHHSLQSLKQIAERDYQRSHTGE